ncbi:MAG: ABC transporter ATP-binding protein [Candidatus Kariarchaeaceae archaeon]|jgi:ABC-2 type transport system ATP-binding protein
MDVITVQNLRKTFPGEIDAVNGVNLSIKKGEIYGFLGPNGAGKSTTIRILSGLLKLTSGSVTILNHSIPQDFDTLRGKLGYVPQELIFYNHLTVRENLSLFAAAYEIEDESLRIDMLMRLLQIDSLSKRIAGDLSGGQKRRLNLAIGLLHEPQILILDEPSAGMDPQSRNILWESIRQIASQEEVTIILTTHLMETVDRLADRIGIIDNGKIIAEGTPSELKQIYGQGDILEITLKEYSQALVDSLTEKLSEAYPNLTLTQFETKLRIAMPDLIREFTAMISLVEQSIGKECIQSITIHENTLEDVFIHLTGRELRE